MPVQSSMHIYLNWTKQRLDEMEAALASLEARASQQKADVRANAGHMIADLKKRRDEFQAKARSQAEAAETAWQAEKPQLEAQWNGFQAQVKTYFETVGQQVEQQHATFREMAAAQVKAWREAADKFHGAASKTAAEGRASVDAAIKSMKAEAAEAEARLHELKQAGSESWTALSAALAETRKAFDQANQKAGDAFKRAAHPKS